ncbi:alpha/beta fold hydrolase [Natrarchaeobaculum sulfurireducens]|uniref:Alpha/beta superfamily hydrolase n=1 Tax=Natrarchaeobaculum sulfurireducens TaxID=2044521 RepID=A0A346PF47_9EURY|nr:alpha/beta hydrolase [Natrarchaeobaculum sulfurireducens]AXR78142.1 Alpha/beta superfamily hydrolase [Natrarchaeobaculum sulfurireducens]
METDHLMADQDVLPSVASSTARTVNDITMHVVTGGQTDAPLVVLLHGFPECWYTWRHQLEALVDAGYRVVVPDQRGYNLSEKPQSVRAYRLRELARDVIDLVATEDRASAHVVGHDWGGVVAWHLALRHPEVVDSLAVANASHPTAYRQHLLSNPEQLRRSWYAGAVQLPWLPERLLRRRNFTLLERAVRGTAAPETYTEEAMAYYRRAWSRTGALTAMLNWYRAVLRYPPTYTKPRVTVPTLVCWGDADVAQVPELAIDSYHYCTDARLEFLPGASHWVPHEQPERTTSLLCEHLSRSAD